MERNSRYLILLLMLAGLLCACGPVGGEANLPEPPSLVLDSFDETVAERIFGAHKQWEATPLASETNGELAMLLHSHGLQEWALVYYQRARLLDTEKFSWVYLHALVLAKLGRNEDAVMALQQALELDKTYIPARLKLAQLLAGGGQDDRSGALYEELLQEKPDLPQALYGLGKLRLKQGDDIGIALLERAVTSNDPYGTAHYALAEAYRKIGNTTKRDEHLELFRQHKDKVPRLTDTWLANVQDMNESLQGRMSRAQRMLGQRRFKEAAELFESVLETDPSTVQAHIVLISTYGLMGLFAEAEAHYHQGLALDPDQVRLHNNFGVLRLHQGRYDEAAQAFQEALRVDPDFEDAHLNLGAAFETSGQRSAAVKQYRLAVQRYPSNRKAGFYLGRALLSMNNPHSAVEQLVRILEPEDEMTPEFLDVLASAYMSLWRYAEAEATLQRAITVANKTGRMDLLVKLRTDLQRAQAAKIQTSFERE